MDFNKFKVSPKNRLQTIVYSTNKNFLIITLFMFKKEKNKIKINSDKLWIMINEILEKNGTKDMYS